MNGIMMKRQKRWQESLVTRPIIVYRDFIFGFCCQRLNKKIDVTCRSDYDAQHPKGTSLADIVLFCGRSYYDFIRNGYTVVDAEKNKPENENLCKYIESRWSPSDEMGIDNPWATVVSDTLKNISYADTKLLNSDKTVLWFTKRPEGHGTFWFDLTVEMSSGLKFSVPVTYQYDR